MWSFKEVYNKVLEKIDDRQIVLIGIHGIKVNKNRVQQFNQLIQELAYKYNGLYVDVYWEDEGLMLDFLHPNVKGHKLYAQSVINRLQ